THFAFPLYLPVGPLSQNHTRRSRIGRARGSGRSGSHIIKAKSQPLPTTPIRASRRSRLPPPVVKALGPMLKYCRELCQLAASGLDPASALQLAELTGNLAVSLACVAQSANRSPPPIGVGGAE